MKSGKDIPTRRFSVIFTATRSGWERFDDLDSMPALLRATCVRTLQGPSCGTVVIADSTAPVQILPQAAPGPRPARVPPPAPSRRRWRVLFATAACAAAGLLMAFAFRR